MAITDATGLPIALRTRTAQRHEVKLVAATLAARFSEQFTITRLIGDKAYDSDPLRSTLAQQGIELIAPHRRGRVRPPTQDGRKPRRYKRRWQVERFFAWLHNYRRCVTRWERHEENFFGFVQLATIAILLKKFF